YAPVGSLRVRSVLCEVGRDEIVAHSIDKHLVRSARDRVGVCRAARRAHSVAFQQGSHLFALAQRQTTSLVCNKRGARLSRLIRRGIDRDGFGRYEEISSFGGRSQGLASFGGQRAKRYAFFYCSG